MLTNIFIKFHRYLKERFPLKDFIPLALIFAAAGGICIQVYVYGEVKNVLYLICGFFAFLLFLLRLRIFDEFKDFEHDAKYYPSRPVPRGLITLNELKSFVLPLLCMEMLLAISKGHSSFILFSLSLIYSLLMFKEFFAREWLRQHFTTYVISHEILALPLFLYIFALNGMALSNIGQVYFWAMAFFLGCQLFLLEVARKIRPLELEIPSRDTYTAQYGINGASGLIICLGIVIAILKIYIEKSICNKISPSNCLPLLALIIFVFAIFRFFKHPNATNAKRILDVAILFLLVIDLVLIVQCFFKRL